MLLWYFYVARVKDLDWNIITLMYLRRHMNSAWNSNTWNFYVRIAIRVYVRRRRVSPKITLIDLTFWMNELATENETASPLKRRGRSYVRLSKRMAQYPRTWKLSSFSSDTFHNDIDIRCRIDGERIELCVALRRLRTAVISPSAFPHPILTINILNILPDRNDR